MVANYSWVHPVLVRQDDVLEDEDDDTVSLDDIADVPSDDED